MDGGGVNGRGVVVLLLTLISYSSSVFSVVNTLCFGLCFIRAVYANLLTNFIFFVTPILLKDNGFL